VQDRRWEAVHHLHRNPAHGINQSASNYMQDVLDLLSR
jgi:hypothetical protein